MAHTRQRKFRGSNEDLAEWFAKGGTSGESYNQTMFIDGDVIYSYGWHFPMAKLDRKKKIAWVNKDKYSMTTSTHQGRVRRNLENYGFTIKEVDTKKLKEMAGKENW